MHDLKSPSQPFLVPGEERCVTSLKTAAKETTWSFNFLQNTSAFQICIKEQFFWSAIVWYIC